MTIWLSDTLAHSYKHSKLDTLFVNILFFSLLLHSQVEVEAATFCLFLEIYHAFKSYFNFKGSLLYLLSIMSNTYLGHYLWVMISNDAKGCAVHG